MYIQSISKGEQWHPFKISIGSIDHSVVCDLWNLHIQEYNHVYYNNDISYSMVLKLIQCVTWSRLAGQVLGSLPAGLTTPVSTSTRALPPV